MAEQTAESRAPRRIPYTCQDEVLRFRIGGELPCTYCPVQDP